jgi:hypothetical protein
VGQSLQDLFGGHRLQQGRRHPDRQRQPVQLFMTLHRLVVGRRLTGVALAPYLVCLSGMLPEWRMEVPRALMKNIIIQLSVVGRPLNLTRLGRSGG